MKFSKLFCLLFAASLMLTSCGDDDKPTDPEMTTDDDGGTTDDDGSMNVTLEEEQDMTTVTLTDGDQKVWRISQANLNNDAGSIDISNNFNVQDDEFVFSGTRNAGTLEWRPGNDIAVDGSNSDGTLLDFYVSPISSSFTFNAGSSTDLNGLDGRLSFTVVDGNTITGSLTFPTGRSAAGETIDLTLTTKTAADYAAPPASGLAFSEVSSIMAFPAFGQQSNVGFVGSVSDNSLFIAHRDDCAENNLRHRVIKLNLNTLALTENRIDINDFFTRKLNIVNNQLILTGGINIYTYDLDIASDPVITPHNAGNLSRFSTATINDDIYVVGGDLDETADKIRKIDRNTGTLAITANMPSPKVHAGSEIVNDNLYVFSGRQAFFEDATAETTSYIHNLQDQSFSTFDLPVVLYNSYAARKENLIYIVGDTRVDTLDDYNIWIGVYNTLDGSITEVSHNLDDSDAFSYVHAMTVFNDKIYVIYGDTSRNDPDDNCAQFPWSILAADLN